MEVEIIGRKLGVGTGNGRSISSAVNRFMSTGAYESGTTFTRLGGNRARWTHTCPKCSGDEYVREGLCSGEFSTDSRRLAVGAINCRCSSYYRWTMAQREYQIKMVLTEKSLPFTFVRWVEDYGYKSSVDHFVLRCSISGDFKKRVHNFINSASYGPAHWDTDNKRTAHLYVIKVWNGKGGFTGYGISGSIDARLSNHRGSFYMLGHEYTDHEVFAGTWKKVTEAELKLKASFPRLAQDIDGFRTEATDACNYDEVLAFVGQHCGLSNSIKSEVLSKSSDVATSNAETNKGKFMVSTEQVHTGVVRESKYNPQTKHSNEYYKSALLVLIDCLTLKLKDFQIADKLNELGIKSPTGLDWKPDQVKQTLKKIRLYNDYPSKFHAALLQLVFDGEMSVEQSLPLFSYRKSEVM